MVPGSVREARLQERVGDRRRCLTCEHRCVLGDGETGVCGTRVHRDGTLRTLIYGVVSSLSANPIEKKPLYHFFPGSRALTAGSWRCNFACPWCQNFELSTTQPPIGEPVLSASEFVDEAVRLGCRGTSISFNEPTLSLEWAVDVFREARRRGLYNTVVTNGYMTPEALALMASAGLDGLNVDLKGDAESYRHCGQAIDAEKVWARCRQAKELGLHLELTTLVVPGVSDRKECLESVAIRVVAELGAGTPWHLSRYFPALHFTQPATSIEVLEQAAALGRAAGLGHVYLGNVPGHQSNHTRCARCGELLVKRVGLRVLELTVRSGRCPNCRTQVHGVGWNWTRG